MKRKSFTTRGLASRTGVLASAFAATLLILGTAPAFAQDGAIEGTVQNASTVSLDAVNNASVFVEGTNISTLTDRQGRYRLTEVPAGEVQVQVTIIGFRAASQSVTVQAGQVVTLDFQLEVSAVRLDEVYVDVLTGREVLRRELSTNVGSLNVEEEVEMSVIQNFSELLTGRVAGVVVTDVTGSVGASQKIRIRGSNSLSLSNEPLIVVDGIYYSNNMSIISAFTGGQEPSRLNDLNPQEIQSIEVVKGPAASALYGAIGANGVILITTKRGTPGGTDWHFYAEGGVTEDRNDYPLNYEAVQVIGDPSAPVFTESGFNSTDYTRCSNFETAEGLCTQDQFLSFDTARDPRTTMFQNGDRQVFGMNVSGGTPASTYFLSGQYEKQNGVVNFDLNNETKYNVRANLDAEALNTVHLAVSVGFVSRSVDFTSNDNSLFSPLLAMIGGAAGFVPGGHPDPNTGGPNPQNYRFNRNLEDLIEASLGTQDVDRFTGSAIANWQPYSWLSAQGSFGLDVFSTFDFVTIQPGLDNLASIWVDGFRDATRFQRQNWTGNGSVNATFDFSSIVSTTTAGVSYQEELLNGVECFGAGLIEGTDSCSSTSSLFSVFELFENVVTLGAFFQQEFSIADRLFLRGSLRIDDNSNFGGNLGAELYPSAGFSYVISDESWFPTGSFLSELKFRGAYGVAGVRPGFRDAITLFEPITASIGGEDVPGVSLDETGNELLKPERTTEYEGGFDLGLLGDRLGIGFTYYYNRSKDALIARPVAPSFGLTSTVFSNLGEVENKGIEVELRALVLDKRNAQLGFSLQATTLNNTVLDIGEGVEPIVFGRLNNQRHANGFPAGSYWDEEFTFNDANGDGLLSRDEVTVAGDPVFLDETQPTYEVAFLFDATFFQAIQINTLFDARGGHSLRDDTEWFRCRSFATAGRGCLATGGQNVSLEDQATFIASRFASPVLTSTAGFVQDAKFLKWRELSVTFNAPPSLAEKVPLLRRTSLTFAGRNLQTWTGYRGIDPEVNETGGSTNFTADEFNTQPPVRALTVRLDVRF